MLVTKEPKWLLVKSEAQTPPTPSVKTPKAGAFAIVAFGASPCLNALAANLLRHRPGAQPNCLRCAPRIGGVDFLLRTVLSPWSHRAASCARWLQCLGPEWAQKKSRFPVADTKENGFWYARRQGCDFSRCQHPQSTAKGAALSNIRNRQALQTLNLGEPK